jgi:osmoprotectant transport system substrate-binding protein
MKTGALKLCAALLTVCFLAACSARPRDTVIVVSKNFTEQEILGELLAQQIERRSNLQVERRFYLGGTYLCQQALLAGRADTYVEYTGTALTAILKEPPSSDPRGVLERVRSEYARRFRLQVGDPLGFNNSFAMVVRGDDARRLGIHTLSQAARYSPNWRVGVGYEFLERPDGFDGLHKAYGLQYAAAPRVMDLGLLYRSLLSDQVDIIAASATDGLLAARDLTTLEDNRRYFPPYEAVTITREETLAQYPSLGRALDALAGHVSEAEIRAMNYAVDGEKRDPASVVREFLNRKFPE